MGSHKDRFFQCLDLADPSAPVRRGVKAAVQVSIAWVIPLAAGESRLGPLGPLLEGKRVGIEHFSTPPDHHDVNTVLYKLTTLALDSSLPPAKQTVLVVVCGGSMGALRNLPLRERTGHPGWSTLELLDATLHVLEADRLASDGTWGFVRFACNPEPPAPRATGSTPHSES